MQKIISIIVTLLVATVMAAQNTTTEYQGGQKVMVGGMFGPYEYNEAKCQITGNSDGTISLTICKYELQGTPIGDLYVSDMTIQNIPYDATKKAYAKDYTADNVSGHIKAVKDGKTSMDNDYTVTKQGYVTVTLTDDSRASIANNFQPGSMPFPIAAAFNGQATATGIQSPALAGSEHTNRVFPISGMPADHATRGIVIRNGRKFIAK